MTFKSVIPGNGGGGSGTVTSITGADGVTVTPSPLTTSGVVSLTPIAAGTLLANTGTASAAPVAVTYGDTLSGGIIYSPGLNALVGTAPTTYYLTNQPDATGISGYYTAARVPNTTLSGTLSGAITGSLQTIANFIAPPGDPGAVAYQAGNCEHLLYLSVDAGAATVTVRTYLRSDDGTETNMGTPTAISVTSTTPVPVRIPFRKQTSQTINKTARIMFRVLATRVSGPATVNVSITFDTAVYRNTAQSNVTGPGVYGPDYSLNVIDYGAVPDAQSFADGVMTAASATLVSATATFRAGDAGKVIEVSGALGASNPPLLTTIASVVANTGTCTLSSPATSNTGTYYLQSVNASGVITGTSGDYVPNDVLTLSGGTFTTAAQVTVLTTQIRTSSLAIVSAGSGGTDGTWPFEGTTGTGTKLRFNGRIVGGVLTQITVVVTGGNYTVNPTNLAAEPVTASGSGLTGATVSFNMDWRTGSPTTAGAYTVLPDDPVDTGAASISGATGAQVNANWTSTGRFVFGTNNLTAFNTAIAAANSPVIAGQRTAIRVPAGNYGIWSGALTVATQPVMWIGDGPSSTQLYVGEGYTAAAVFGFRALFPSAGQNPSGGPNAMFSALKSTFGVQQLALYGNRTATLLPDAMRTYDRCSGMVVYSVYVSEMASALRVGAIGTTNIAYLRESAFYDLRAYDCGTVDRPTIWIDSVGNNAKSNYLQFFGLNVANAYNGPLLAITGHGINVSSSAKEMRFIDARFERPSNSTATGDLIQLGAMDATDDIAGSTFLRLMLVSAQSGYSGIATYAPTAATRPNDIVVAHARMQGNVPGSGLTINAGQGLSFQFDKMSSRATNVVVGSRTNNQRSGGTISTGSTTSAVNLGTGASATDSFYNGGALAITFVSSFTASFADATVNQQQLSLMTVSAVASGSIIPGQVVTGTSIPAGTRVISQVSGSAGSTGTYYLSLALGTLTSRAMTGSGVETRIITAYVGSTRVATVGALAGSAATYTVAPTNGLAYRVDSLVDPNINIDGVGGDQADWTYSFGTNSDATLANSIYTETLVTRGLPAGDGYIRQNLSFAGSTTQPNAIITGGTIDGLNLTTLTANRLVYASGTSTLAQAVIGTGLSLSSGTLSATGTGTVSSIIAAGALSGGTITSTGTVGLAVSTGLTISAAGTIAVTNATTAALGGVIVGSGLAVSSGTVSVSNTIVVGLSNSIADTITAGTYDLGPFINGGTILNSYAHVVSGTIAFGVAIGQPGTYTDVTGLTAITSTSTTIDTIGTATAANVISAGAHAWLKVTTGAVGGDVFITVKVP